LKLAIRKRLHEVTYLMVGLFAVWQPGRKRPRREFSSGLDQSFTAAFSSHLGAEKSGILIVVFFGGQASVCKRDRPSLRNSAEPVVYVDS